MSGPAQISRRPGIDASPRLAPWLVPNDPAIGVVNLETGVVTHVDPTLQSPKGLLLVPSSGHHHGGH
jgi:hypothetical protein